jgi:hypothetical protein
MNASPPEDTLAKLGAKAKRPDTARTARPDASKVMTVFVLIVVTLYFGREVLVPVTLALLLTFLLAPPVGWFRKIFGRVLSVVLVVTLALGVLIAIGGVIVGQLRELAIDLPNYTSTIESKVVAGVEQRRSISARRAGGAASDRNPGHQTAGRFGNRHDIATGGGAVPAFAMGVGQAIHIAFDVAAGNDWHCVRGGGVRAAAARGFARPLDPIDRP